MDGRSAPRYCELWILSAEVRGQRRYETPWNTTTTATANLKKKKRREDARLTPNLIHVSPKEWYITALISEIDACT